MDCNLKSVSKEWFEDLLIQTTWQLLEENNAIDELVYAILKKHKNENKENALIKSLEKRRNEALKASNNLIAVIEQGFVTEQTKIKIMLKELEAQIAQYEFDIEQAKQRNYSYITSEKIKDYFQKVTSDDIETHSTRVHIIKYLVREIILYEDCIVITYNFTDKNIMKKTTPDDINEVERELKLVKNREKMSSHVCTRAPTLRHIKLYTNTV